MEIYIVGGHVNWQSHFGKLTGSIFWTKRDPDTIPLLAIYPIETSACVQQNMYKNVQSSFNNDKKLEAIQIFIHRMDKLWYIHTMSYKKWKRMNHCHPQQYRWISQK